MVLTCAEKGLWLYWTNDEVPGRRKILKQLSKSYTLKYLSYS